jgi:hypothetical protein
MKTSEGMEEFRLSQWFVVGVYFTLGPLHHLNVDTVTDVLGLCTVSIFRVEVRKANDHSCI